MKQSIFTILSNPPLTDCVYKMVLSGDTSAITAPGQFVNIQITGKFLRRPISVCDYDGSTLTIVYKVVGKGTEILSRMVPGEKLDILTGLGNGYDLAPAGDSPGSVSRRQRRQAPPAGTTVAGIASAAGGHTPRLFTRFLPESCVCFWFGS